MVGVANRKRERASSILEEIEIRGLGVIDSATIEFAEGLNVITGETGAGKTMVLTALALVSGGKSDVDLIRSGQERLNVSGRFRLPPQRNGRLNQLLEEHDPELDDHSLLLNRTLGRDGKSRAFLGGASTTASTLQEFASELFEIHGQHGSMQLSKAGRQRELLDEFAGAELQNLMGKYREQLREVKELSARLEDLRDSKNRQDSEVEELRALVSDHNRLKPGDDELTELSTLIARLENVEEFRLAASGAREVLDADENGILTLLALARRSLGSIKSSDPELERILENIEDSIYTLGDASADLTRYLDSLEADPGLLESSYQRRSALISFGKKYGKSQDKAEAIDEAMERYRGAKARISDLDGGDERIKEISANFDLRFKELKSCATQLSEMRKEVASRLDARVVAELRDLAMPDARFKTTVITTPSENLTSYSEFGIDEVTMTFSSHGGELLPIAKAASGGELSRLMLALEVVIASRSPKGTYIFDEVDAGIGGKTALEVGKRLRVLAKLSQVIVVTHLPQVAIWADHHLQVKKNSAGSITSSSISVINGAEREIEIARMLSGVEDSEHAQEHARELLELRKVELK